MLILMMLACVINTVTTIYDTSGCEDTADTATE
jgi:hypothetical protein